MLSGVMPLDADGTMPRLLRAAGSTALAASRYIGGAKPNSACASLAPAASKMNNEAARQRENFTTKTRRTRRTTPLSLRGAQRRSNPLPRSPIGGGLLRFARNDI